MFDMMDEWARKAAEKQAADEGAGASEPAS